MTNRPALTPAPLTGDEPRADTGTEPQDAARALIAGDSDAAQRLRDTLRLAAACDAPVMLIGPTGSGKELAARAIHAMSTRRGAPYVAVNIAALPDTLVEAELFGHERGAFTGAVTARTGRLEQAGDGVLLLDEVGDMPAAAQLSLLRVIEDRRFTPVGGNGERPLSARIIAATHHDLPAAVAAGRFREDLWYRLSVLPVRVPSLMERARDIPAIAAALATDGGARFAPTPDGWARLIAHDWPGNVRELRNVVARAALLPVSVPLDAATVSRLIDPLGDDASQLPPSLDAMLAHVERQQIDAALSRHGGTMAAAARDLGLSRTTLSDRARRLGLSRTTGGSPA